jgi:hypothetical protein
VEKSTSSTIPDFCGAATRRVGSNTAPFFPSAGRGTTRFWGNEQGLTAFLWEDLGEEGREEFERVISTHRDWVVWSRAQPMKGDRTPRGFEHAVKGIFCGKVKQSKKEQGEHEAEDEIEEDAPDTEVVSTAV